MDNQGQDQEQGFRLASEAPPAKTAKTAVRSSTSPSFTVREGDANDLLLLLLPPGPAVANPAADGGPVPPAALAETAAAAAAAVDGGVAAAEDGSCVGGDGGDDDDGGGGGGGTAGSAPGGGGWDFIDVDPFGSCLPFLEAAVAGVNDGGVLAVAATDLAVLCGKRGGRQVS